MPKQSNLRKVKVNAKQCKIYKVLINDTFEAKFDYYDLTMEIVQEGSSNQYILENFSADHRNAVLEHDPDAGGGGFVYNFHGVRAKCS